MKARIHIIIMLMAMTIGTLAASAQSANRDKVQRDDSKKTTTRTSTNTPRQNQSVQDRSSASQGSAVKKVPASQSGSSNSRQNEATRTTVSKPREVKQTQGSGNSQPVRTNSSNPAPVKDYRGTQATDRTNRSVQAPNTNRTVRTTQPANTGRSSNNENPGSSTVDRNDSRKVSTTNGNNPRSDYRAPDNTKHVGKTYLDPKASENTNRSDHRYTAVYNGNNNRHNHVYYPHKEVKIHVHPVTYQNHYRVMYYPAHRDIYWTRNMYRSYVEIYPGYTWRYPYGYMINTINAFEAVYNIGEVSRVYGRVYGTWFNHESDDLLLFFGGEYPNQEFTIIIPGHIARRYSWRPERYFLGQHVLATGLITSYEGRPEMIVRKKHQLDIY